MDGLNQHHPDDSKWKKIDTFFNTTNLLERYALVIFRIPACILGDQGGGKCATELGSQALLGLHAVHQKLKRIPGDHSGCDAEVLKATGGVMWGVLFWLKDVKERKFCCIFRPCFSTSLLANSCWEEKTPGRAGRWQQSLQILEEAAAKIRPMPGIAGTGRERWEMMSLEHW